MATSPTKQGQRAEVSTFVQGLITEASPLNFPANASRDEENYELNRDGTRDRRLGMDYEPDFALIDTGELLSSIDGVGINTFKWFSVAGLIDKEFLVAQVNQKLFFFDLNSTTLSDDGFIGQTTLSSFPTEVRYSFAALEGKLVVAAGTSSIAVVTYDIDDETFSSEYSRLKTRDVWGVESKVGNWETDVSYRSSTIDNPQYYNLQNQSWGMPRKNKTGVLTNPLSLYSGDLGVFPSNSEVVWTGLQYQPVLGAADPYERIYTNLYTEVLGADIKAPKGYYIIDVLDRGTSRMAAYAANGVKYPALDVTTTSLPTDSTPGGATCLTDFAGRVWYAGFSGEVVDGDIRSPVLSNYVLFSTVVRSPTDITKCYQEGDPTSRDNSDLLDTDGGFLRVSGAKNIIGLRNLESHLIVIATNGVWSVSGGNDYGFTATNYKVSKLSSFGGLNDSSIVVEGGRLFYWSDDGIYVVGKNQFGDLGVESLTRTTIQTKYENIPLEAKETAIGTYDTYTKKVKWVYKSGELFTTVSVTRELIFDLTLNAFYEARISKAPLNKIELVGAFPAASFNTGSSFEPVYVGTEFVFADAEQVGVISDIRSSGIQSLRYLTLVKGDTNAFLTFSYYRDNLFRDWYSNDLIGVDAKAYLLTGSQTLGDSAIDKQIPYLIMHFRRTEVGVTDFIPNRQSSCLIQSQWNWANSIKSGKWSKVFQAYRYRRPRFVENANDMYDNGFETVVSKNKLRGRGEAFAMYIETEPLKDCRILGWSLTINGNSVT